MHGRQGSHASYNAQTVVDEKYGLIVNSDVVNDNNDLKQFANQIEQAHETIGSPCKQVGADAGYSNSEELEKIDKQGIKVIVPTKEQASKEEASAFDKSAFQYIPEKDSYLCPEGHVLRYSSCNKRNKAYMYAAGVTVCRRCCHWGVCTNNKSAGRTITRYINQPFRDKLVVQYTEPDSQAVFARRKQTAELPFGHIKRNLGVDSFLLRGLEGVCAEMSILSNCFNVTRLIGLFGVSTLIAKLGS